MTGAPQDITGQIGFDAALSPFMPWNAESNAHIGLLTRAGTGPALCIAIRIFEVVGAVLIVTDTQATYPSIGHGHVVVIDPITGKTRDIGMAEELGRMVQPRRRDGV